MQFMSYGIRRHRGDGVSVNGSAKRWCSAHLDGAVRISDTSDRQDCEERQNGQVVPYETLDERFINSRSTKALTSHPIAEMSEAPGGTLQQYLVRSVGAPVQQCKKR